ncbi:MAG: TetR/AcrR family transcriptional regulator [Clostridia bacterium]|nr:TetR/AcrR family transcriptional regulator [Clostridia bacterium]
MSLIEAKKNFVIDKAVGIFSEKSMSRVTIRDIAQLSGIGEATIYRYFGGRKGLILACAIKLQRDVREIFLDTDNKLTGYEAVCRFYNAYLKIFNEHIELYRFLSEFDAFCLNEGFDNLSEYADNIDEFKFIFMRHYRDGVASGELRKIDDVETFYLASTHALLALCKKLAAEGPVIRQDVHVNKTLEISALINIILYNVKAPE